MKRTNKMRQTNKILIVVMLLAIVATSFGCTGNITGEVINEKSTIKIGVIAPLTGEAASYGQAAKQGLDFAVQEINNKGGIDGRMIELVYEDSKLDPVEAVNIMNKFINVDNLELFIIADGSGDTMAIAPLADQNKVLMIGSLASSPKLTGAGEYFFRTVPSDAYQGKEIARIADEKGFKRIAILNTNDAYGEGIKQVFSDNTNADIVATESFSNGDTDFRTQLTKIKGRNPDAIVLVARSELPNILKQMRTLGIDSAVIGSETTKNQESIDAAAKSAEGMYSVFFSEPNDYAGYKENYEEKYGVAPDALGYYSYDALHILSIAIDTADSTDPTVLKDELAETVWYGATGIVSFDDQHDVKESAFSLFKVENGKFVEVE